MLGRVRQIVLVCTCLASAEVYPNSTGTQNHKTTKPQRSDGVRERDSSNDIHVTPTLTIHTFTLSLIQTRIQNARSAFSPAAVAANSIRGELALPQHCTGPETAQHVNEEQCAADQTTRHCAGCAPALVVSSSISCAR